MKTYTRTTQTISVLKMLVKFHRTSWLLSSEISSPSIESLEVVGFFTKPKCFSFKKCSQLNILLTLSIFICLERVLNTDFVFNKVT